MKSRFEGYVEHDVPRRLLSEEVKQAVGLDFRREICSFLSKQNIM